MQKKTEFLFILHNFIFQTSFSQRRRSSDVRILSATSKRSAIVCLLFASFDTRHRAVIYFVVKSRRKCREDEKIIAEIEATLFDSGCNRATTTFFAFDECTIDPSDNRTMALSRQHGIYNLLLSTIRSLIWSAVLFSIQLQLSECECAVVKNAHRPNARALLASLSPSNATFRTSEIHLKLLKQCNWMNSVCGALKLIEWKLHVFILSSVCKWWRR